MWPALKCILLELGKMDLGFSWADLTMAFSTMDLCIHFLCWCRLVIKRRLPVINVSYGASNSATACLWPKINSRNIIHIDYPHLVIGTYLICSYHYMWIHQSLMSNLAINVHVVDISYARKIHTFSAICLSLNRRQQSKPRCP